MMDTFPTRTLSSVEDILRFDEEVKATTEEIYGV